MQKLTNDQAAIISIYTGILCCSFLEIHKLAQKLLDRPVWTHEFGDPEIQAKLKELAKPLFLELCADGTNLPTKNGDAR